MVHKPVTFAADSKGQSIAIALGTLACCRWPLLIDLTDGFVHHLLQLKGKKLLLWEGLSATEAYYKIATELTADPRMKEREVDLDDVDENDDGTDADLRAAKRLRLDLKVTSTLSEQLDSILPFLSGFEKYRTAQEIISSHVAAAANELEDDNGATPYLSMFS